MPAVCLFLRVWRGLKPPRECTFPFSQFDAEEDENVSAAFFSLLDRWAEDHADTLEAYKANLAVERKRRQATSRARSGSVAFADERQVRAILAEARARKAAAGRPAPPPPDLRTTPLSWDQDRRDLISHQAQVLDAAGWLHRRTGGGIYDASPIPIGPTPRFWFGWLEDESGLDTALKILTLRIPRDREPRFPGPSVQIGHVSVERLDAADRYLIENQVHQLLEDEERARTAHAASADLPAWLRAAAHRGGGPSHTEIPLPALGRPSELLMVLARETVQIEDRLFKKPAGTTDAPEVQSPPDGGVKIYDYERRAAESFEWALRIHPELEALPRNKVNGAAYKKVLQGARESTCPFYDAKHPVPGHWQTWARYARDGLRKLRGSQSPGDSGAGGETGEARDE